MDVTGESTFAAPKEARRPFRLSIAIPLYNEEAVVGELLQRLAKVLDSIEGGPHEVVFVDDGSTDSTVELIEQALVCDSRFILVALSRNFGHQASLTAALDHTSGDAVVMMDADLQDRPEAIPQFIAKFREGYDVVYAKRILRKESLLLRLCYKLFYQFLNRVSDLQLPVDAGDFGLISRRVVNQIVRLREQHRYLRGLRSWVGFRQVGIEIERDPRFAGEAKYDVKRLLRLATDGIFAFSTVPIRVAALLGAVAVAASSIYAFYAVYVRFVLHISPQGFTALIFAIVFLSGVHLLFLSIIGEYVGRVYEEVKKRPIYIVDHVSRNGDK